MWGFILLIIEILKLMVHFIIAGLKIWWGAMCWCFIFLATAFEELKTLSWQNEKDKPKIIKDAAILTLSVAAIIFLIWLLISIATGRFGSSSGNAVVSKPNKSQSQQETIDTKKETSQSTSAIKNYGWGTAPNNPNEYIFYDENGNMIKNKDYKVDNSWYYFDENGYMVKDKWHGDYYYGADGKMATNQWIGEYYVGSDGKYVQNPAPTSSSTQQETSLSILETTAPKISNAQNTNIDELYIVNKEVITEYFDYYWTSSNDEHDVNGCEISISKPIIAGANIEEVEILNTQVSNLIQQLLERLQDEDVLSGSYRAISVVNLNKSRIEYTDNKVTITLNGTTKYTSGHSENNESYPTFIIEYNRKNKNSKMNRMPFGDGYLNIPSDEIFYAE